MAADATALVRQALGGTGIELVASCAASAYDARAPAAFRSAAWLREARGVIVAGSAGPALWRGVITRMRARPDRWSAEHPYDTYVAELLARADQALAAAGIRFQRFEAAYHAPVRVDFLALATPPTHGPSFTRTCRSRACWSMPASTSSQQILSRRSSAAAIPASVQMAARSAANQPSVA